MHDSHNRKQPQTFENTLQPESVLPMWGKREKKNDEAKARFV